MNEVNLLKLIADLIKSDKPTVEEIKCARTILANLISSSEPKEESIGHVSDLDNEALQARKELM